MARIDRPCIFLLVCHCNNRVNNTIIIHYFVPFPSYLTLNNIVTLKSGLEMTQGH